MTRLKGWLAQDLALSVRCACTGLVALGAAYASYRHGREFTVRRWVPSRGKVSTTWPAEDLTAPQRQTPV
jgi:hypothetical protein